MTIEYIIIRIEDSKVLYVTKSRANAIWRAKRYRAHGGQNRLVKRTYGPAKTHRHTPTPDYSI